MKIHRSRYALSVFFCFLIFNHASTTTLDDLQATLNVLKAKLVELVGQLSGLAERAPSTSTPITGTSDSTGSTSGSTTIPTPPTTELTPAEQQYYDQISKGTIKLDPPLDDIFSNLYMVEHNLRTYTTYVSIDPWQNNSTIVKELKKLAAPLDFLGMLQKVAVKSKPFAHGKEADQLLTKIEQWKKELVSPSEYSYIDEFVDDPESSFVIAYGFSHNPNDNIKFSSLDSNSAQNYYISGMQISIDEGVIEIPVGIKEIFDPYYTPSHTELTADEIIAKAFRSICALLNAVIKNQSFGPNTASYLWDDLTALNPKPILLLALAYAIMKNGYTLPTLFVVDNYYYFFSMLESALFTQAQSPELPMVQIANNCMQLLFRNMKEGFEAGYISKDTLEKILTRVKDPYYNTLADRQELKKSMIEFLDNLLAPITGTSGSSQTAAERLTEALAEIMPGGLDLNGQIEWTKNQISALRQLLNDAVEESSAKAETIPASTSAVTPALFEKYARLIDPYFDPNSDIVAADLGNPETFDDAYTAFENFVSIEITETDVENLKIFVPQYIDQVLGKYAEFKEMGTPKIGLNILTPFDAGQARITLQQRITDMNINFDNVFDILTQAIQSPHLIQQIVPLGEIVLNNILPNEIIGYALLDHVNPTEDEYHPTKYANKIRQIIDFCVVLFSKKIPPNNEPAKSFEDGYNSLIAQLKLQRGSLLCAYMLLKAGSDNPRFLEWLHHEQFLVWALKAAMYYIDQETKFDNTPARTELYIIYEILKHVQRSTSGSDALLAACRAYTQDISAIAGEPNEGKFDKPEYGKNGWQIKRDTFRTILARKLLEAAYRYEAKEKIALQKIAEQEALIIHLDAQKRHNEELARQHQAEEQKLKQEKEEARIATLADAAAKKQAEEALQLVNDERVRQAAADAAAAKAQEDAAEQQRLATLQATFQQEEFKTTQTKSFASNTKASINALRGWIEKTLIPDAQQSIALRPGQNQITKQGGAPYIATFNVTGESAAGCKKTDIIGWLKWLVKCHEEAKDTSTASFGILESLKKQTIDTENCYEIAMKYTTIIVQNILQDSDSLRTNLIQINSEGLIPITNFCKLVIELGRYNLADFPVPADYELIADFIYLNVIPASGQEENRLRDIVIRIATAPDRLKPFARKCATLIEMYINEFYKPEHLTAIRNALSGYSTDPEAQKLASTIDKLASSSGPSEAASSS